MKTYEVINSLLAAGYYLNEVDEFNIMEFKKVTNDIVTRVFLNNCLNEGLAANGSEIVIDRSRRKDGASEHIQRFSSSIDSVLIDCTSVINLHDYISIVL